MKKILTLFAFAIGVILSVNAQENNDGYISGTDFNSFAIGEGDGGASVIGKDDSGGLEGTKYWGPVNYQGIANVEVSADGQNTNLFVNTSGEELVRSIGPAQDLTGIQGTLFFDSKVQFTATDSLSSEPNTADKLIVWLKETQNGDTTTTNLVVTASQITGGGLAKTVDYDITGLPFNFNPGEWYRLTIVAHTNAFNGFGLDIPAFAVYVNENLATYDSTQSPIAGAGVTVASHCQWLKNRNALFPSLQISGTDVQTISKVAFQGYGYLDDIEFSTALPNFAKAPAELIINWGEGIASITVQKNNAEDVVIEPGTGTYGEVGATNFNAGTYTITTVLKEGYFNKALNNSVVVDASTENEVLDFVAQKMWCKIGEEPFASLEEALAHINNTVVNPETTITLCENVETADALTISKNIVLDLAGKKITSSAGMILAIGANVTVISSIDGGELVNNSNAARSSAIFVNEGGSVTIGEKAGDYGVKITGPAFDGADQVLLVRAKIQAMEEIDVAEFMYSSYLDEGSETSASPTVVKDYWVITPKQAGTFTVTFEDGVDNEEITVPVDQEITSGNMATKPTPESEPTREGYAFLGWFLKTGDTVATDAYDFTVGVTGNITLVAKWANSETPIEVPEDVTEEDVQIQIDETSGNTTVTIDSKPVAVIPPRYTAKFEDDKIVLTPQVPVIGATKAENAEEDIPAFDVNGEIVAIGIKKAFKGLFYRISAAADLATLKGLGDGCTHTNYQEGNDQPLKLVIPKGNGTVGFFTVTVTDKKPTTPAE